jgi:hypothetical protein
MSGLMAASAVRPVLAAVFKLCFRSSEPFGGVYDLDASRRSRPASAAAIHRCCCRCCCRPPSLRPTHVGKVTLLIMRELQQLSSA